MKFRTLALTLVPIFWLCGCPPDKKETTPAPEPDAAPVVAPDAGGAVGFYVEMPEARISVRPAHKVEETLIAPMGI